MVKEEDVLVIREEYDGYRATKIEAIDDVFKYMDDVFKYFNKLEKEFNQDIEYNKKCIKEGKKFGIFKKLFGYKDSSFYKTDNELINKEILLVEKFEDCYDRLSNDIKENNYSDVYKLARFAKYKFHSNYEHLEEARRNNELLYDGLYFDSFKIKDDSLAFIEFFDDEINNIM